MPTAMTNDSISNHSYKPAKALRIRHPSEDEQRASELRTPSTPLDRAGRPKSILKEPVASPTDDQPAPDPLDSESFFLGPLRTIVASIEKASSGNISVHDTTEAYILLSCRIEAQAIRLDTETSSSELPAVRGIRQLKPHMICAAIRRDVAYAISITSGPDNTTQSDSNINSNLDGSMTDEEKIRVRDRSSVCHSCLRFLANVFKFPALYSVFKTHELAWIFKELLDVGLSSDLLTLNPKKTYSHVLAVLSVQRLPGSAFKPFLSKIALVIERAASGLMGGTMTAGPHIDGLRAAYAYLRRHGALLFKEFHKILKVVLQNLIGPILVFRELAGKVLSAFAHAALRDVGSVNELAKASSTVGAFIDKETQRAKGSENSNVFVLRDYLKFSERDPRHIQQITTLLNIIASLLVLSGPNVFTRPNSLRFLIKAIEKTQPFRLREINVLRSATWSCLVRSYALLSSPSSWVIPSTTRPGLELEESAFRVIRQEYREDVGISVLAVLLAPLEGGFRPLCRAREAVTYLYHLGGYPETRGVAAALLRRLVGGVLNDEDSEECSWKDPGSVVPEWLADGSTLGMEPRKLRKALGEGDRAAGDMHNVRILEADELTACWEGLLEAFQSVSIGRLFDRKAEDLLSEDIMLLWRALLRTQEALAEGFSRTTVSKLVLTQLTKTVCAFLDATLVQFAIRSTQALCATLQLWVAVQEELSDVWASALASMVLRRLLKLWQLKGVSVGEGEGKGGEGNEEWVKVARVLVEATPKRAMELLGEVYDEEVQRVVWLDMVGQVRYRERPDKDLVLYLLLFPIRVKKSILQDETELGYWDTLFLLALMHEEPDVVFSKIAEELERALATRPAEEFRQFFVLSLGHASRSDSAPNTDLLSVTSDYLEEVYPPDDYDDNGFFDLGPALRRIFEASPGVEILKALERGLVPWFEDKRSNIQDIVYNNDVLPLYCGCIRAISQMSVIEDAIIQLADLLRAPFSREHIPEPAIGPVALKEFWDSIAPGLDFRKRTFPSTLTDCVVCLADAYGCYVPEWMESQLDSQISRASNQQSDEVVPPSFEDLESSDFSPIMAKKDAQIVEATKALKVQEKSDEDENDKVVTNAPDASPSLGEPTQRFINYQRFGTDDTPTPSIVLGRATKRRKVRQSVSPDHDSSRSAEMSSTSRGDKPERFYDRTASPETDDYANWEVGVASQDIYDLLDRDGDRTPRPPSPSQDLWETNSDASRTDILNKAQRLHAEHRVNRSQTAPASLPPSNESKQGGSVGPPSEESTSPTKLRRTHTTTDVPLDTLEKLHAKFLTEADCIETQDLPQATKFAYDLLGMLNGRMSEKLGNRK